MKRYNRPDLANKICAMAGIKRKRSNQYFTRAELVELFAYMSDIIKERNERSQLSSTGK